MRDREKERESERDRERYFIESDLWESNGNPAYTYNIQNRVIKN